MALVRDLRRFLRNFDACIDGHDGTSKTCPIPTRRLHIPRRHRCVDPVAFLGGEVMTEIRGTRKRNPIGIAVAFILVVAAAAFWLWTVRNGRPRTDDASIDAEVIHVASLVGGKIIDLPIHENEFVHKGDLLFRIDPFPYQTNVAAAEAQLEVAQAAVASKRRLVTSQQWNAEISSEQIQRAKDNLALSQRTEKRLAPLAAKGYVPEQQFDQAKIATQDATTSLLQAQKQESAAHSLVDTVDAAQANVRAAAAALANARRALRDTEVRAEHDGRVTGLTVSTGEIVAPSQSLFTLINAEEWFASANFRETDLGRVRLGACVTVYSMVDHHTPIKGIVQSIGYGVLADDKIDIPRSVPYVEPSLNWVRVAHRFPVRIRLEHPPEELVRLGATAFVEIDHGRACR